ncbi:lysophospholipid acyltransferase family protein [Sediminicoccus sp. KRV36]|uniref:lysophospholipid acyltransferase family protein n=1 Tax=Sediminicoccus sp. KRV36 TaxID=3133721 RepID=UPI00200E1830|nr:lysophospholipid acyltransferase family protein [Sediminicoccus rosea]UPY37126.1 lysophospholipid acyltransferase family protein [Sediminicoccus rosea]
MTETPNSTRPGPAPPDRRAPTLRNRLLDLWEITLYQVFRRLPIDLAPTLSRRSTVRNIREQRPWVVERARANLKRHRPEASDAQIEAWVNAFLDNIGRQVGEVATVGRQYAAGRIEIVEPERAQATAKRTAVVALCLHTGNWEVMLEALQAIGLSVVCAPIEWESRGQTWVISDLRKRNGLRLLPPDAGGLRAAMQEIRDGGILAIFVDEAREGKLMAPLFGRPPHLDGNLGIAARIARRTRTPVVLCYVTRIEDRRFRVFFGEAIDLPPDTKNPLDDVQFLNDLIEPVILERLEQWFFLDDEF